MNRTQRRIGLVVMVLGLAIIPTVLTADERRISLAAASSPNDAGFFEHVLPEFEADTGIQVDLVVASSRDVLDMASDGYVDAVISHRPDYERRLMNAQIGLLRRTFMSTDYVLAGPDADPARVRETDSPVDAMRAIFDARQIFLSRADDSGPHYREMRMWRRAGVTEEDRSFAWYQMTHTDMAPTLQGAGRIRAYTIVDRPTWLQFGSGGGLEIVYEDRDDRDLHDVYTIIVVNPEQVEGVDAETARELADWLVSDRGRELIRQFQVAGEQAYWPVGD